MQAGGAFFWPANVLRVIGPAKGAQLRILAPARLGHEAFALGSAGTDKQAAQAPRGRTGPAGSRAGSRRSPRARLWSPGSWEQPAVGPNPRPGRGAAAGRGGPVGRVGPDGAPPPNSRYPRDPAARLRAWGTRVGPKTPRLDEGEKQAGRGQERLAFFG